MYVYRITGTGHRPNRFPGSYSRVEDNGKAIVPMLARYLSSIYWLMEDHMDEPRELEVISGMAQGWDMWLAEATLITDVPTRLIAAIPCLEQDCKWPKNVRDKYWKILEDADEIVQVTSRTYHAGCMQKRDRYMVDRGTDLIIACLAPDACGSGTWQTVDYGLRKGRKVVNMWDSVLRVLTPSTY